MLHNAHSYGFGLHVANLVGLLTDTHTEKNPHYLYLTFIWVVDWDY